jgi:hypothetical protein
METIASQHHDTTPDRRYALDAVLDDADHVEAALRCFAPLIGGGLVWRRRVSPHLADAHLALARAAIGLRIVRHAIERELSL